MLRLKSLPAMLLALLLVSAPAQARYFEPYESDNTVGLRAGDILIETKKNRLSFALDDETIMVFPVAVGRQGRQWKGVARIGRMAENPAWHPTADQRKRKKLPAMVKGGPGNPLGVYALYLFQGGRDTLYRIHGTNAPSSIGRSVSDGCIRMRNDDVLELADYVEIGARVTVR